MSKRIPVVQLTKDGKFIQKFPSFMAAACALKTNEANIGNAVRHRKGQRKHKGFIWVTETEYMECFEGLKGGDVE